MRNYEAIEKVGKKSFDQECLHIVKIAVSCVEIKEEAMEIFSDFETMRDDHMG